MRGTNAGSVTIRLLLVLLLAPGVLGLGGCIGLPDPTYQPQQEAGLRRAVLGSVGVPDIDLLVLDADTLAWLDRHVDRRGSAERRLRRLRELLFDADGLDLAYDGRMDGSAQQVFAARRGNCLSMTNLFIAMARHLDLQAGYQRVFVEPTWDLQGEITIRNDHINARGSLPGGAGFVVDFLPQLALEAGDDTRLVADHWGRALYFTNLGVASLLAGDLELATEQLRIALAIEPQLTSAWNNLGAVLKRRQQPQPAEYAYRQALVHDPFDFSAMGNLAQLYQQQGETALAEAFLRRVAGVRERNPYYHFALGRRALAESRPQDAVRHFREAARRKQTDPQFFIGMAEAFKALGDDEMAHNARLIGAVLHQQQMAPADRDNQLLLYPSDDGVSVRFIHQASHIR